MLHDLFQETRRMFENPDLKNVPVDGLEWSPQNVTSNVFKAAIEDVQTMLEDDVRKAVLRHAQVAVQSLPGVVLEMHFDNYVVEVRDTPFSGNYINVSVPLQSGTSPIVREDTDFAYRPATLAVKSGCPFIPPGPVVSEYKSWMSHEELVREMTHLFQEVTPEVRRYGELAIRYSQGPSTLRLRAGANNAESLLDLPVHVIGRDLSTVKQELAIKGYAS